MQNLRNSTVQNSVRKDLSPTILVIDDDPDLRDGMAQLLTLEGYHVLLAENGEAGIEILSTTHPDLILLDMRMPHFDGNRFLEATRSAGQIKHIPVVAMSAGAPGPLALEVADHFMQKPMSYETLSEVVKRFSEKAAPGSEPIEPALCTAEMSAH